MSHALYHSISSQKKHGGKIEDYYKYHEWFDESKRSFPDNRHRAMRHHTEGIWLAEQIFGKYIVNSDGKKVPVRTLGEQHVREDLGWIPTMADWLQNMKTVKWMLRPEPGTKTAEQEIRENHEDYIEK